MESKHWEGVKGEFTYKIYLRYVLHKQSDWLVNQKIQSKLKSKLLSLAPEAPFPRPPRHPLTPGWLIPDRG